MIRLTDDDSIPRVEDASERFMHLCGRIKNGGKYQNLIKLFYDDFEVKKRTHELSEKATTSSLDVVKLHNSILGDILRDVQGRAKEIDRNNSGSDLQGLLFPDGLSPIVNLPDKEEPAAAHAISLKVTSLGAEHALYPFAAQIETAIKDCEESLADQVDTKKAEEDANTTLTISKIKLVNQYNTIYHIASTDYGKAYAEKLYPQLRPVKKEEQTNTNGA